MSSSGKEALRQQMLLRALWRDTRPGALAGWLRDGAHVERGLLAYRANAAALAERALAAAYPTLVHLLGAQSFAALAQAFWHAQPPQRGDIGTWGGALPDFVADAGQLASEPYLADLARLEWALHGAERAADAVLPPQGLEQLATADPSALWLRLQLGTALLRSAHPVVGLWLAHRSVAADRFVSVREALAAGRGDNALVQRRGWKAVATAVGDAEADFTAAVLAGHPLGTALTTAGPDFAFEPWFVAALQAGLVAAVTAEAA